MGQIRSRTGDRRGRAAASLGRSRARPARALGPVLVARAWDVVIALIAVGFGGPTMQAHAQCQYEIAHVLSYPIDCSISSVETYASAVNRHGTMVGRYKCPLWEDYKGFLWTTDDGVTALVPPAGVHSVIPSDINDAGVICGTMVVDGVGDRGFILDNGVWTELPPVVPESGWSFANAISNSGVVVGRRQIGPYYAGAPYNAYIWSPSTGFLDLGVMSGGYSSAAGITESGIVVGYTGFQDSDGFILQGGVPTFLGPIPGGITSKPNAATEDGTVVGAGAIQMEGYTYGVLRAFLWKGGTFTMLGTLPGHLGSVATSVRLGQVVGRSVGVNGNTNITYAFLWQNGVMNDLSDLVVPALWITNASIIAHDGSIMAYSGLQLLLLKPIDPPVGDLDLDCRVGIVDFLNLLTDWGPCPKGMDCFADLNGDGEVELIDLVLLLENWG